MNVSPISSRIFPPAIIALAQKEGLSAEAYLQNAKGNVWSPEQKKQAHKNLNVFDGNVWKKNSDFKKERKNLLAHRSRGTFLPGKPSCLNATIETIISAVKIIFSVPFLAFSALCRLICGKFQQKNLDRTTCDLYYVTETNSGNLPRS